MPWVSAKAKAIILWWGGWGTLTKTHEYGIVILYANLQYIR